MIPDSRKRNLGEDAFFISENQQCFGVADGVGSWAMKNIDAGEFSRRLMMEAKLYVDTTTVNEINPKLVMMHAEKQTIQSNLLGTCTYCTLALSQEQKGLQSICLGDSGFAVFRQAKVVYKSLEQQHVFNMPFQIGLNTRTSTKKHGVEFSLKLRPNDVIVCGTDGLFDNIWMKDMCQHVGNHTRRDAQELAQVLAEIAVESSMKSNPSPFSTQSTRVGYASKGGKQDDVTCLVAIVD